MLSSRNPTRSSELDFPAGVGGTAEVDDFDAIGVLTPAWSEVKHSQLGRGRQLARVSMAHTARLQIAHVHRSPGVMIRGGGPRGATVLALLLDGPQLHGQGQLWEEDRVGVLPRGSELEMMGVAPHSVLQVAVAHELLDEAAQVYWGHTYPTNVSGPCLRLKSGASRHTLIATWEEWLALGCRTPERLLDPGTAARMHEEVLGAVLESTELLMQLPPTRPRRDLALRAARFIRDSLREHLTLDEICSALGAVPRTLHASFKAEYGTSPMAYRKAMRLDASRRDLQRARPSTTVSEVAAALGFFEFGYFSVDYRQMFGESPRDTLRRARATVPKSVRT